MVIWHPLSVTVFSASLWVKHSLLGYSQRPWPEVPLVLQLDHLCNVPALLLWFIEGLRGNDGGWYLFFVQHDVKTLKFHMFFQHGYPKKQWSPVFERKTLRPVSSFIKVSCSVFILKFYCNVWYFWWDPSNRIPEKKGLPFDEILLNFIL